MMATIAEVKILWARMCRELGVPASSQFVVGMETTRDFNEYNAAMSRLQAMLAARR